MALSREQAGRLVIAEQAGGRGFLHWIAVHCDAVKRFQQRGGRGDDFTIAGDPPFSDHSLDFPARGNPRTRQQLGDAMRSEGHTSELQSLMRISYAVFCLKKKNKANK